jgi:hypothetical protein
LVRPMTASGTQWSGRMECKNPTVPAATSKRGTDDPLTHKRTGSTDSAQEERKGRVYRRKASDGTW